MTEPATSTGGASVVVAAVALFGPAAGEYAAVLFGALAGALWALSAREGITRGQGAMLVLRLVLTAFVLTGLVAAWIESQWAVPAKTALAPAALAIAAIGDRWRDLVTEGVSRLKAAISGGPRQ